ncbi:MAG: hypothetical protein GY845_38430 [Planctomycetes bacterium]|nr:hypothetical protein [Planctomycetota bacterium]
MRIVYALLLALICITINCGDTDHTPLPHEQASELSIHGCVSCYLDIEPFAITTQDQLEQFITTVQQTEGWDNRQEFIDGIIQAGIDFSRFNLVYYEHYEGSESTKVYASAPYSSGDTVIVDLTRISPDYGVPKPMTLSFAYLVDKRFDTMKFKIEDKKDVKIDIDSSFEEWEHV